MSEKGTIEFTGTFDVRKESPIDPRTRQAKFADLLLASTWTQLDNLVYRPNGLTIVVDDDTDALNGYYFLPAGKDYTVASNWIKSGSGSGTSTGDVTYEATGGGALYAVGDEAGGGIIIHILTPEEHGHNADYQTCIVTDVAHVVSKQWNTSTAGDAQVNYETRKFGWGKDNTDAIVAAFGEVDCAAQYCKNLSLGGYDDWYLPSLFEAQAIFNHGYSSTPLWTSTELGVAGAQTAMTATSSTGYGSYIKTGYRNVVPVRTFLAPVAAPIRDGEVALFSGTSGKNIKRSGKTLAEIMSGTSGVSPASAEAVLLTVGLPTYTLNDAPPDTIRVSAETGVSGEIILGTPTTAKGVTIQLNCDLTIDAVVYLAGVTLFAFFDSAAWSIDSIIDPAIPDYADIAVQQISTTGSAAAMSGVWIITGLGGITAGNLLFLNNPGSKSTIGVYRANANGGASAPFTKIASGTSLNVVRVAGGSVYHSDYDGVNLASLTFKVIGTGGAGEINVIESLKIDGKLVPITEKELTILVDDSVTVDLTGGVMTIKLSDKYKNLIYAGL